MHGSKVVMSDTDVKVIEDELFPAPAVHKKHLVADQKIPAGRGSNPCAPTIIHCELINRLTNILMLDVLLN